MVSPKIGPSLLGVLGVTSMTLSVAAALGLLSHMRVNFTPRITEVIPYFMLAVGTGNLFILTDAYKVNN